MKFLTLAVLATTLMSTSAKADAAFATTEALNYTGAGLLATSIFPTSGVIFCTGHGAPAECPYLVSSTQVLTTTGVVLLLKEDIVQVQPDIYNFLAGEEITLALEEQMKKVRRNIPELAEASDEEVASTMLQILSAQ